MEYAYSHLGGIRSTGAVTDLEGKRVGAGIIFIRGIREMSVCRDINSTVASLQRLESR